MELHPDRQTATRATLSPEWLERQKYTDWMHAPSMADYVNRLVSGLALADGGHWANYARERHLRALELRRGHGLSMLSLGCGDAHIEQALISEFHWPIAQITGLEFDAALLASAKQRFASLPVESSFYHFDFNDKRAAHGSFDLVFVCHALHHAFDLEGLLPFINRCIKPDGVFVGIEFFGPTRFQLEPEVVSILEKLFGFLPSRLRQNLTYPDHRIETKLNRPTIAELMEVDPSESARSSDLRTLLFSNFPVLDIKPMGGTLLRWLLQYRAGNFEDSREEDVCILRLLQFIEESLISTRVIRSDDLFFVLGSSARLATDLAD